MTKTKRRFQKPAIPKVSISIRIVPELIEAWETAAKSLQMSKTGYLTKALTEELKRDGIH